MDDAPDRAPDGEGGDPGPDRAPPPEPQRALAGHLPVWDDPALL